MRQPTLQEEKKLWKRGYKFVACLDEAGRGPLAGPVAAGAVMIIGKSDFPKTPGVDGKTPGVKAGKSDFLNIKDSKKLSAKQRDVFYSLLTKHKDIKWGIGIVSEKIIDKINILEATKLAMIKAVKDLESTIYGSPTSIKIKREAGLPKYREIGFLILDGNFKINYPLPQKSIVKADEKVFSCAAASIIAKVTRDRIMMRYHKKYPQYGFDKHKGYPTKYHYQMIKKYGPCQIHRKSYKL